MSQFTVRATTLDDLKFIHEITSVANAAYNTHDGWTTEAAIVQGEFHATDVENFIKTDSPELYKQIIALEDENKVVGCITAIPFPDLQENHTPGEAMITRFAVHPSYQSKGLGKLLVLEILKEMKNMGYHTCSLRVFSNRPEVLGWYGRLGFKETGERRKFNPLPGKKVLLDVDFIIMKKEL